MLLTVYKTLTVSLCLILILAIGRAAEHDHSPIGLWQTFDDKTHKARGTIRIFEENGTLSGRIETSFNPKELTEHCDKCPGDRKDEPIIGLTILRGIRKNDAGYDSGEILDPETGYIYRCKLTMNESGDRLSVRGYLGLSVFGRTQTWARVGY